MPFLAPVSAAASVMPLAVFGSALAFVMPMPEAMLTVHVLIVFRVIVLCVFQVHSLFFLDISRYIVICLLCT
jgi:hypothetical protein